MLGILVVLFLTLLFLVKLGLRKYVLNRMEMYIWELSISLALLGRHTLIRYALEKIGKSQGNTIIYGNHILSSQHGG